MGQLKDELAILRANEKFNVSQEELGTKRAARRKWNRKYHQKKKARKATSMIYVNKKLEKENSKLKLLLSIEQEKNNAIFKDSQNFTDEDLMDT